MAVAFRGRVFSRAKNKGEANIVVYVTETGKGYQTDADGYFDAEVPESNKPYTFRILRDTGLVELKKSVSVDGEVISLSVDKKEAPKGSLQVEGTKEKTVLSRYKVRYDEIKRMPGTLGEALNSLQTLPGVFAPPFGFGNLVIRGADPDTNTYLYDDLPILYAYHFDTINSVIHNDLIKTIDLYTGAFPANYNNALGGIIEIESTDSVKKASGQFSTSILMSQAMYQAPLWEGKGYLAAGGKVGYLDKTIGQTGLLPEGIRLPQYKSSNVKFSYKVTEEHKITFTSLTADDNFVLNAPRKKQNDPTRDPFAAIAGANISAARGFHTIGLRHEWTPGTKFYNRFTLIYFNPYIDNNIGIGAIDAKIRARAPYLGLRQDLNWNATDWLQIDFGTEARSMQYVIEGFVPTLINPNNPSPNPFNTVNPDFQRQKIDQTTSTKYFNAYTTVKLKFGGFSFEPGIRYDYIDYSKQGVFGPRGTVSYKFSGILNGTTIFGGAGMYNRYPFFSEAISDRSGNRQIEFEKAFKYSGGIEQFFTEEWSLKIEGFKNEFSNLIVRDAYISDAIGNNPSTNWDLPNTYLLGQPLSSPWVTNKSTGYQNSGDGWAKGIEVFLKKSNKPNSRDWFGWVSYTWSQTFRNDNVYHADYDFYKERVLSAREQRFRSLFPNTQELIYDFDITHLVSIVYGWRIDENWQVGGRWQYRTAYPYTPVIGDDGGKFQNPVNNQTLWSAKYSDNPYTNDYKNSRRQTPYHRLDIRIDKFLNYEWGFMNIYFEVLNVYIRQNNLQESYSVTQPYSKTNPSAQSDFFILNSGKVLMPFYNVGLEVRF
jgi:hypothetical protein